MVSLQRHPCLSSDFAANKQKTVLTMAYRRNIDKSPFDTTDDYTHVLMEHFAAFHRKIKEFVKSFGINFNDNFVMPDKFDDLRSGVAPSSSKDNENVVDTILRLLGYGEKCQNGGVQMTSGICRCPEHYHGRLCETIECLNNGTRTEMNTCLCDEPLYVRGQFCEFIDCQNSGIPINGEGKCKCLENWYMGRFCEQYTAPWLYIFLVIGVALILLIVFCVLCRLRQYKKEVNNFNERYQERAANRRRNELPTRYNLAGQTQLSGRTSQLTGPNRQRLSRTDQIHRQAMLQLHLNENGEQEMRLVPPPSLHQASHVSVPPAYSPTIDAESRRNDQALASMSQFNVNKPGTPPPTYDQVMSDAHLYPHDWRRSPNGADNV